MEGSPGILLVTELNAERSVEWIPSTERCLGFLTGKTFCGPIGTERASTLLLGSTCDSERCRGDIFVTCLVESEYRVRWRCLPTNWMTHNRLIMIILMTYWILSNDTNTRFISYFLQRSLFSRTINRLYSSDRNSKAMSNLLRHFK